jgi:hypothetical protein
MNLPSSALLLAVALVVSASSKAEGYAGAPWHDMTYKDEAQLRKLLLKHGNLKDPSSAQFRDVEVRNAEMDEGRPPVASWCGYLNAKNGFGAYTGFTPFVMTEGLGEAPSVHIDPSPIMLKLLCAGSQLGYQT